MPPPPLATVLLLSQEQRRAAAYEKVGAWIEGLIEDYLRGRCNDTVLMERVDLALERGEWGRALDALDCASLREQARRATHERTSAQLSGRNPYPTLLRRIVPLLIEQGHTNKSAAERIQREIGLAVSSTTVRRLRRAP